VSEVNPSRRRDIGKLHGYAGGLVGHHGNRGEGPGRYRYFTGFHARLRVSIG